MSITFQLATRTGDGFGPACTVNHGACIVPEHLLDEDIAAYSMPGWCVECSTTNRDACEVCGLSVNVSNHNAQVLLGMLGVEFDWCGSFDPADLLGRALTAGIDIDDSGHAATVDAAPGRATLISGGLRPGYYGDRFGALADLATHGAARGLVITWG